jgi:hypothetical protein
VYPAITRGAGWARVQVLHCFENFSSSPAFQSFHEGLYHIMVRRVAYPNQHTARAVCVTPYQRAASSPPQSTSRLFRVWVRETLCGASTVAAISRPPLGGCSGQRAGDQDLLGAPRHGTQPCLGDTVSCRTAAPLAHLLKTDTEHADYPTDEKL